jgi:hypothetical protein
LDDAMFCDLCGKPFEEAPKKKPTINVRAPKARLVAMSTGKSFDLEPDEDVLVGRGDPARGINPGIRLNDDEALSDGVSRLHAKVFCEGNEYFISDLNSTNSTYLNKQKLLPQERYRIEDGDEIQLGRFLLRLSFP